MKTIYLVRHAKSSWGDVTVTDFERKLSERGKTDAPEMAKRLLKKKVKIDAYFSSPAKSAKKTCTLFAKEFEADKKDIHYIDELYLASPSTFANVIHMLDDEYSRVAIFAHNPGITDYANTLCEGVNIDNMPTCSVFGVSADINSWEDFAAAEKQFLFFEYPKAPVSQ